MASKNKTSGTVRACTPREFENLLRRALKKPLVERPTSLRVVWSRPAPLTEIDPFDDAIDDAFEPPRR
jgi:hypothetical protein